MSENTKRDTVKELFQTELHLHFTTDKAILVSENGERSKAFWLPLSMIDFTKTDGGKGVIVTLPEWLAAKHKLG